MSLAPESTCFDLRVKNVLVKLGTLSFWGMYETTLPEALGAK